MCLSKENAVLSPLGWVLSWVPQGWGGDVSLIILRLGTWGVWDLEKCPHGRVLSRPGCMVGVCWAGEVAGPGSHTPALQPTCWTWARGFAQE